MTLFKGQTENAGHFLQPTTNAIGQMVIALLLRFVRRECIKPRVKRLLNVIVSGAGRRCNQIRIISAQQKKLRPALSSECHQRVLFRHVDSARQRFVIGSLIAQALAETDENKEGSWNARGLQRIIGSSDVRHGQNTLYLGDVGQKMCSPSSRTESNWPRSAKHRDYAA